MGTLRRQILAPVPTPISVLIHGEAGSGKELVARYLHDFGPRVGKLFMTPNCTVTPKQLFESKLFGHENGAFINVRGKRIDKLEHAHGSTLSLNEIESMPLV